MQLPRSSGASVIRLQALPRLESPIAAVRGLACLYQPGERRSIVGKATALASKSVLELKLDLGYGRARRPCVDRAPGNQRHPPSAEVVADMRASEVVDRQCRPRDVATDDGAGERRCCCE